MRFYRNIDVRRHENFKHIKIGDLNWYAVRTPPLREFTAETILRQRGYAIICPVLRKRVRASRTTKRKKQIEAPLIPGYVLMGFSGAPDWHKLFRFGRRQELVTSVCGHRGRAQAIPESSMNWIARMIKTIDVEVIDRHEHGFGSLKSGDNVEVLEGPFQGHVVRVEELSGKSATCLIDLFGGKQNTKISVDNLQKVA